MNGTTKVLEVQDGVQNGGQTVAAVAPERRAQEIELLKQMRVKVARLDPASVVSTLHRKSWVKKCLHYV